MTNVSDERAQSQSAAEQVKEQVQDVAEQAKGQTRQQLRSQIDARSTDAGEQLTSGAEALRRTSEQLRSEGKDGVAKVIAAVADRGGRLGSYLTGADGEQILHDAEDFARRQPWVFVGGSAVLGFLASRFMKASSSGRYQKRSGPHASGERQNVGLNASASGVSASPVSPALAARAGSGS